MTTRGALRSHLSAHSGANVESVQRMLGHASAAMTLDVYAALFDDDLEAVSTASNTARASAIVAVPRAPACIRAGKWSHVRVIPGGSGDGLSAEGGT